MAPTSTSASSPSPVISSPSLEPANSNSKFAMKNSATASATTNSTATDSAITSSATAQAKATSASQSRSAGIARQILESHKKLDRDIWPQFTAFEDEYTRESIAGQHANVPFHTWALQQLSVGVILSILEAHFTDLYEALPARHKGYIERLQKYFELSGLWNLYFTLGHQTIQSRDTMEVLARIVKSWPDEDLLLELEIARQQRISLNTRGQRKSLSSFQLADAKAVEVRLQKRTEETEARQQKKKAERRTYISPAPTDRSGGSEDDGSLTAPSRAPQPPMTSTDTTNLPSPRDSPAPSLLLTPRQEQVPDTDIPDSPHGSVEIGRDNAKGVEHFEEDSILQDRLYSQSLYQHSKDITSSDDRILDDEEWHGEDTGFDIRDEDTDTSEHGDDHQRYDNPYEASEETTSIKDDCSASVPPHGVSNKLISKGAAARSGFPESLAGEDDSTFTFQLNPLTENVSVQRKVLKSKHTEPEWTVVEKPSTAELHEKGEKQFDQELEEHHQSGFNEEHAPELEAEQKEELKKHQMPRKKDESDEVEESPDKKSIAAEERPDKYKFPNVLARSTIDNKPAHPGLMINKPPALSPNTANNVVYSADQPTTAWKTMYSQHPGTIKVWETSIKEHQMLRDDFVHFLSFSDNCLPEILVLHPLYIKMADSVTFAKHPAKFLRYSLLLVPLYHPESIHFSLVVVDVSARSMVHYDSLESSSRFNQTKKHVLPWMASIFAESSSPLQLSATRQKCFQQSDGVSCGLIVAAWANVISQNLDVPDTWDVEILREDALNRLRRITPNVDLPLPPSVKAPVCIDLEPEDEPVASGLPSITDNSGEPHPADVASLKADNPDAPSPGQLTTLDALQACLAQASVLMAQYHSEKGDRVQELQAALQSDRERESSIQTELPMVAAKMKRLREEHYVAAESGRHKREKYNTIKTYFASTLAQKPDGISNEDIAIAIGGQRAVLFQLQTECDTLDRHLKQIASGVDTAQKAEESCKQELIQLSEDMERRNGALERQNGILQAVQKLQVQSEEMKGAIRGFVELDSEEGEGGKMEVGSNRDGDACMHPLKGGEIGHEV